VTVRLQNTDASVAGLHNSVLTTHRYRSRQPPATKTYFGRARYPRCRNARYQGYPAVLAWRRPGHTQEAMGEPMSLSPDPWRVG